MIIWTLVVFAAFCGGVGLIQLFNTMARSAFSNAPGTAIAVRSVLLFVPVLAGLFAVTTAAHRALAHPEDRGVAYFKARLADGRVALSVMVLVAMFAGAATVTVALGAYLLRAIVLTSSAAEVLVTILGGVVGCATVTRFAAAPQFALHERSLGLRASWRLTAERPIATFVAVLVSLVILIAIFAGATVLVAQVIESTRTPPGEGFWRTLWRVSPGLGLITLCCTAAPVVLPGPGAYAYRRWGPGRVEDVF